MKATLEFNLPDEEEDFFLASNAYKLYRVISDLLHDLRSKRKYESINNVPVATVEDFVWSCLNEEGLGGRF